MNGVASVRQMPDVHSGHTQGEAGEQKSKTTLIHTEFFLALKSFEGASGNVSSNKFFAIWLPVLAWPSSLSFARSGVRFVMVGLS